MKNVTSDKRNLWMFPLGTVGRDMIYNLFTNFIFTYILFTRHLTAAQLGAVTAIMVGARVFDALNDPVMGNIIERTRTRWGRYRPWLLIGAPLTAVVLVLTFWAHPAWPDRAKSLYMYITYCVLVLGYTCVNIPYGTLCGTLTQNIEERAKINTSRSVLSLIHI